MLAFALDNSLFRAINQGTPHGLDHVLAWLSITGNFGVIWFAVLALVAICAHRHPYGLVSAGLVGLALATGVNTVVKHLVDRARPPVTLEHVRLLIGLPGSASFPSGHAASAFGVVAALATVLIARHRWPPFWWWLTLLLALLISLSRIVVGVHFPSDVAVGAIVGIVSGIASALVLASIVKPTTQ